jgi:hypothetical protein
MAWDAFALHRRYQIKLKTATNITKWFVTTMRGPTIIFADDKLKSIREMKSVLGERMSSISASVSFDQPLRPSYDA